MGARRAHRRSLFLSASMTILIIISIIATAIPSSRAYSAASTHLVKDINPGFGDSSPSYLTAVGSTLYFAADDGTSGTELWKSDGTSGGTVLVKDINPGAGSSNPSGLTAVGSTLFFDADDSYYGRELWKSNGTASGTILVKDINPGSGSSRPPFISFYPPSLTPVGSTLFFPAFDGVNGVELWKSDGTLSGTVLVKDINSGYGHSFPQYLAAVGSTLFFSADDGNHGFELWSSQPDQPGSSATALSPPLLFVLGLVLIVAIRFLTNRSYRLIPTPRQ